MKKYKKFPPLLISSVLSLALTIDAFYAFAQHTIKGHITFEGRGVKDVVVSSGHYTTRTNVEGLYILNTGFTTEFVQISVPGGYIAERESTIPVFFKKISANQDVYDFTLFKNKTDDKHHVFFAQADVQVTSRNDLASYRKEVVQDMKNHLLLYKGVDVFGLDLGDMVGDMPALFPEYIASMSPLDIPFYRVIGNHDMNYWGRSFETSERTFNSLFGPTVYSFNKGNAHYIVLNNSFYLGRDYFYMGYIDEKTFQWLEQDLSFVPKGSLVFLMMHIPTRLKKEQQAFSYSYNTIADQTVNATALYKMLEEYNTHILSGHMHYNLNLQHDAKLYEHNTAAVCGTWWKAPVCIDGTPRGYAVYEVNGNDVKWYYKSAGFDKTYQFRAYYSNKDNEALIIANVWNYDTNWKVEWLENGKVMGEMERFKGFDPLAFELCSDKKKMQYDWISPVETDHLFRVKVKNKGAFIQVKVTDHFGNMSISDVKTER